jgi:hypothetical protein
MTQMGARLTMLMCSAVFWSPSSSSRRCVMFGLSTPQQAVLKIVNDASPNETTMDRIRRVLEEFAAQDRTKDETHH